MIKQIESESMQSNNLLPFIEEAPQAPTVFQTSKTYPLFDEYRRVKEGRYTFKKKRKQFTEWDDDIMNLFCVKAAESSADILLALRPVAQQVGFHMRVGNEVSSLAMPQIEGSEKRYVKIECSYPLKSCQFYLLYQLVKDQQPLLFACHLEHTHEMGPIPL